MNRKMTHNTQTGDFSFRLTSNLGFIEHIMFDYLCVYSHTYLFLAGQYKTKEIKHWKSSPWWFKVNGRGSLCGSKEVHGSLLRLLFSENIPEKGHGVNDSRQLFQNGILSIF